MKYISFYLGCSVVFSMTAMQPKQKTSRIPSLFRLVLHKLTHTWQEELSCIGALPEFVCREIVAYSMSSTLSVEEKLMVLLKSCLPIGEQYQWFLYLKHRLHFLTNIKNNLIEKAQKMTLPPEDKRLLNQIVSYSHSCFGSELCQPVCRTNSEQSNPYRRTIPYHLVYDMP